MEAIYLLCSFTYTVVSSTLLSILLAIRSNTILSRLFFPAAGKNYDGAAVRFYEGRVRHCRTKPVINSFEYQVRYALFDLERVSDSSHLSADRARQAVGTDGPVFLLTIPTSVGYEMNPLKVYYCYDASKEGEEGDCDSSPHLKKCIAEVTNTPWGEKAFFEFSPGSDLVAKPLHVSPFMDMAGNWIIHADEPGENLSIYISVLHPTLGKYFNAQLSAKRVHSSTTSQNLALYFWLMPHKVAMWIYWQAVILWWRNVPFIGHPKYSNSSYRDDALSRDSQLCPLHINGHVGNPLTCNAKIKRRWFTWRDADWPWA